MNMLLTGLSLYMTFHTAALAMKIWRSDNKLGGLFIAALSGCFLPLWFFVAR